MSAQRHPEPVPQALPGLRAHAAHCRDCPPAPSATQSAGVDEAARARPMRVGEPPGDRDDLAGRPFARPAAHPLEPALPAPGWTCEQRHITNAVEHFKDEPGGQRRLHETPGPLKIPACTQGLRHEIDDGAPRAIVGPCGTAARALLGRPVTVRVKRGPWRVRADRVRVRVTAHPCAPRRRDAQASEREFVPWVDDLVGASLVPEAS